MRTDVDQSGYEFHERCPQSYFFVSVFRPENSTATDAVPAQNIRCRNALIKNLARGNHRAKAVALPPPFLTEGVIMLQLKCQAKSIFLKDKNPIDKKCRCETCLGYSRGYMAHLARAKEMTASILLTAHNLYFFNSYVENVREKIKKGLL